MSSGGVHWVVDVYGYDPVTIEAPTKGAARYRTFLKFCEAFGRITFRDFLARGVVVQRSMEMMEPHDCNFHGELRVRINDRCPLHRAMHNLARCLRDAGALCAAWDHGTEIGMDIGSFPLSWHPGCGGPCPGWRES